MYSQLLENGHETNIKSHYPLRYAHALLLPRSWTPCLISSRKIALNRHCYAFASNLRVLVQAGKIRRILNYSTFVHLFPVTFLPPLSDSKKPILDLWRVTYLDNQCQSVILRPLHT